MSRPKKGKKIHPIRPITREDIYSHGVMECPLCGKEYPTFRLSIMIQQAKEQRRNLDYYKGDFCPICRGK